MAPTSDYPILTKRIGEESTTLLSIVMHMTTRKTVNTPILKAVGFFIDSEHIYCVTVLHDEQHCLLLALVSNSSIISSR